MKEVVIIDYALGNLRSVAKALEKTGCRARISSEPDVIRKAPALVLPGVGAFRHGMENLNARGLTDAIHDSVNEGKPLMGICLGLQLLFAESEEHGIHKGLALIPGRVKMLRGNLKVPQMGWNRVRFSEQHKDSGLFKGIEEGSYFYFVHSYYVDPEDVKVKAGITDYGMDFASAVIHDNIFATQFHPEKSGDTGLKLLKNWRENVG